MIAHKKEKSEILRYLKTKDYRTMFYDGLLKALRGITTLEEVYRMVRL
jgi:general secretion pathway protein E/type IV pilus assembly protein PilB